MIYGALQKSPRGCRLSAATVAAPPAEVGPRLLLPAVSRRSAASHWSTMSADAISRLITNTTSAVRRRMRHTHTHTLSQSVTHTHSRRGEPTWRRPESTGKWLWCVCARSWTLSLYIHEPDWGSLPHFIPAGAAVRLQQSHTGQELFVKLCALSVSLHFEGSDRCLASFCPKSARLFFP